LSAGKAAHPDLVSPEKMVESAVDRAKKCASVLSALVIVERIRCPENTVVLPDTVFCHCPDIFGCNHLNRLPCTAGTVPRVIKRIDIPFSTGPV
jgi:hypothetical protein